MSSTKRDVRSISLAFPSCTARLWLWEGTEDEEAFRIYGVRSEAPYVRAYGVTYYLTEEEKKTLKHLMNAGEEIKCLRTF